MSYVLAFDAATEHVAIGLAAVTADGSLSNVAGTDFAAPRAALGRLLPAVDALLADAGVSRGTIATVAVGRGPGSFTVSGSPSPRRRGWRTAWRSACRLGTLDAVAWRFLECDAIVGIVGDAMRGEGLPVPVPMRRREMRASREYRVAKPASAAAEWAALPDAPTILAGNGLAKYGGVFATRWVAGLSWRTSGSGPTGASTVAAALAERDEPALATILRDPAHAYANAHPGILLPVYTRLSDAEEAETRRNCATPGSGVAGPPGGAS